MKNPRRALAASFGIFRNRRRLRTENGFFMNFGGLSDYGRKSGWSILSPRNLKRNESVKWAAPYAASRGPKDRN
jgi:hypothetical protein